MTEAIFGGIVSAGTYRGGRKGPEQAASTFWGRFLRKLVQRSCANRVRAVAYDTSCRCESYPSLPPVGEDQLRVSSVGTPAEPRDLVNLPHFLPRFGCSHNSNCMVSVRIGRTP